MRDLTSIKRIILKVGSSSLVDEAGPRLARSEMFSGLLSTIHVLMQRGCAVTLVTSGAIPFGMKRLGFTKKPRELALKQACASVGQAALMETYQSYANEHGLVCAQILVSHDDFENRARMLSLSKTFATLENRGILPIVNENDALANEEIKVGDNDTLAAMLCPMVAADLLILLSDIDGLYTANPKTDPAARLVPFVSCVDEKIDAMAGGSLSAVGTGGMTTKLKAARIASSAGSAMVIMNARDVARVPSLLDGEEIGTWFAPQKAISARGHWLAYRTHVKGALVVDDGAREALLAHHSLLPSGIRRVDGEFLENSIVYVKTLDGAVIAKGITPYTSAEIDDVKGLTTAQAKDIIKRKVKDEVIHANDMVILYGDKHHDDTN